MGQALVDQRWQQYLANGRVTINASALKGVLGTIGLVLLSALCAGIGYGTYRQDGVASVKAWGCGLVALLALVGILVVAAPLVRKRRLDLTASGLMLTARHGGSRVTEIGLEWDQIESVTIYRNNNGEGTTSTNIRMVMRPDARAAHVDLPTGLTMSKKDLATLMERIRLSRT